MAENVTKLKAKHKIRFNLFNLMTVIQKVVIHSSAYYYRLSSVECMHIFVYNNDAKIEEVIFCYCGRFNQIRLYSIKKLFWFSWW